MPTPTVINKYRYSDVINRQQWDNKYFFDPMNVNPTCTNIAGGAAAGGSAEVDAMVTNNNAFEYFTIVGNAKIQPKLDGAFGLDLSATATSTHGVEYDSGITPQNPFTFTIDTSGQTTAAFFVKAQFKVATINGVNPLIIGFRKLAARNATYTAYTDYAVIGQIGGAGHFQTDTNIGNAGHILTDTTQTGASATLFQLAVLVDSFGNVTYQINGETPTP